MVVIQIVVIQRIAPVGLRFARTDATILRQLPVVPRLTTSSLIHLKFISELIAGGGTICSPEVISVSSAGLAVATSSDPPSEPSFVPTNVLS